ncbi:unnamed protein product [Sphagnum troendelagicum]
MRVWRHGVRLCVGLALLILAIRAFPRLEAPTPKSPLSFSHKLVEVVVHTAAAEEAPATEADSEEADSSCEGRRIFMHELPSSFNTDLLAKCNRGLADWIDFCEHWLNEGFGKRMEESSSSFRHWYATNNYLLEVILRRRMVTYPSRILIPCKADAFFIPYYGRLEALEYLYGEKKHLRDTQGASLINWLKQNAIKMWSRYIGADHFMVRGRTSWDFFRPNESSWDTKLLQQPELASVTALMLEKMPWKAAVQEAVPYPSSFHPPSHAALQ